MFYESTTHEIKLSLKFNDKLGTRLVNEPPESDVVDDSVQDDWMEAGEMIPKNNKIYENLVDKTFDWHKSRANYTTEQLNEMTNWIQKQKDQSNDLNLEENELPDVDPEQLNRLQRFTYNVIEDFKLKNE